MPRRLRSAFAAALPATGRRRGADETGLALLDVLLGMAIFALIVIIALPQFIGFRTKGSETTVRSDLSQLVTPIEDYVFENQTAPALNPIQTWTANAAWDAGRLPAATLSALGVRSTKNTQIAQMTYLKVAGSGFAWAACATHTRGGGVDAWAIYSSQKGAILATGQTPGTTTYYRDGTPATAPSNLYAIYCADVP